MIENQSETHVDELTKPDVSELREAQLDAVKGGFCGFKIPVSSQTRSKPSTSDIAITKTTDA